MGRRRDHIDEILSWRSRLSSNTTRFIQTLPRINAIDGALQTLSERDDVTSSELMKYIPIGCVACIEAYFRLVYRDLIDYGAPFSENCCRLADIKLNIHSAIAIGKKISVGELIAHFIDANSPEDINTNMSLILGQDFFATLKTKGVGPDNSISLVSRGEETWFFENLTKLFELRNIFCHEVASSLKIDFTTGTNCFGVTCALLVITERLLQELLV